ncbi:phospholipase D family protein [Pseudoruegeria sp. HB172150]|uniref:phospholipase D family protein n=1 Tax=Pseudoruegeria sp. HB172150 TaxID=2721164 RepID=UPI0020A69184|nr:phospholipase D family protein [Pseudoruegeria sp. HB172150]
MRLLFPLPELPMETASVAIPATEETMLGASILPLDAEHPDQSGVYPLFDGRDALAARILLADAAENSIDVQYYIWQMDTSSWLLLDALKRAADRGVRVRMLLDDNGVPGLDNVLSALNAEENIEVRLFNPFTLRSPKLASYLFDFPRLNRRMHNKSMTADGAATIIGGRNIGDIYFSYGEGTAYFDLDTLAIGDAAGDVAENFDDYWTSGSSYPAELVLAETDGGLQEMADAVAVARASATGSDYLEAVKNSQAIQQLANGELDFEWTDVTLYTDDPAKGLAKTTDQELMIYRLFSNLEPPESKLSLVSAYLIPGERGTELISGFAQNGVEVRLLTNSLDATDVSPVHSAWMGYREDLLEDGVEVLELRASPDQQPDSSLAQMLHGSLSSLHAKTFAIDDQRIFIGSFNFDPRSARLNTEMGFLIESPDLAQRLAEVLHRDGLFYEVKLTGDGSLEWTETEESGEITTYDHEPNTTAFKRGVVKFMSWLPIEWML